MNDQTLLMFLPPYLITFCPVMKLDIVDIGLVGRISLKQRTVRLCSE